MKLIVNGTEIDTTCSTLQNLVNEYKLNPRHVVAEVDREIIERDEWDQYALQAGANVELVQFVGGG